MHTTMWSNMFSLDLPLLEKILRPIIVYLFLVAALRLAGKRELAQLNPFDLVVLISLSNTVQNAIIGNDNSVVGGLIGASSLLGINFLLVRFLYRHPKLDELAEGDPDVLVRHGRVNKEQLAKNMITEAELASVANRQGFRSIAEVEEAVLQPGGGITMIAKQPTPEAARHQELLHHLQEVQRAIEQLRRGQQPAS
jgi:uncharacterized membrane protein YcaP (DUF421 family)